MSQRGLMDPVCSRAALALTGMLLAGARVPTASPGCHDIQEIVRVPKGASPVLEYRRMGVPFKPYVVKLCTPSGMNVLRDDVQDHPHHHGLMLAWMVDGVNFWEEVAESGKERSDITRERRNGLHDALTWLSTKVVAVLHEERYVDVLPSGDPQATLVSWRSKFSVPQAAKSKPTPSKVSITGAHYHGLGMRFLQAMDGGTFTNSESDPGVVFRGEERLARGRWCAYTASVDGKVVTIAMFDHPGNVRPATWFTMPRPFGYLSATVRLHEIPLELEAGRPMVLRYGIALWDGHADAGRIAKVCEAWLRRAGR